MKVNSLSLISTFFVPLIIGLIAAVVVYMVLTGRQLPLISGPRAGMIALLILGMAMCGAGGIGQVGLSGRWASPIAIAGYLFGTAILVIIAAAFAGWKLPLINGDQQSFAAVAVLMLVKYVFGTLGFFFHWL